MYSQVDMPYRVATLCFRDLIYMSLILILKKKSLIFILTHTLLSQESISFLGGILKITFYITALRFHLEKYSALVKNSSD